MAPLLPLVSLALLLAAVSASNDDGTVRVVFAPTTALPFLKRHFSAVSLANNHSGDPPLWTGWIVKLTFPPSGRPALDVTTVERDAAGIPHSQNTGGRAILTP